MSTTDSILELAHELGFDLAGMAPLQPPRAAEQFQAWLDQGHHADMAWLERSRDRILDPRKILEGGLSVLALGLGHARQDLVEAPGGQVARYAMGRDYHNVLGKRLKKLTRILREKGLVSRTRWIVDAGPLLERSHAAEAGLGFESKAANLLHPVHGPWFFLAEVLIDVPMESAPASPPAGSCGTCTACLDACPTDALLEPGVLDARRCISYQTIENRGPVPDALRGDLAGWLFGCDICSEVCPWGQDAPDRSETYGEHAGLARTSLSELTRMGEETFREVFQGSPLRRPGRAGLARNAALLLGSTPGEGARDPLLEALQDPSPIVREAAAWSLAEGQGQDRVARDALARSATEDPDSWVRGRCQDHLERC